MLVGRYFSFISCQVNVLPPDHCILTLCGARSTFHIWLSMNPWPGCMPCQLLWKDRKCTPVFVASLTAVSRGLYRGLNATVKALSMMRPPICVPKSAHQQHFATCSKASRESLSKHVHTPWYEQEAIVLDNQRHNYHRVMLHLVEATSCTGRRSSKARYSQSDTEIHPAEMQHELLTSLAGDSQQPSPSFMTSS